MAPRPEPVPPPAALKMRKSPCCSRRAWAWDVVDGEALEEHDAEAGAGAAADGVEDEEALEPGAVVGELADAADEHEVGDLLADGVVAAPAVVDAALLAGDDLLRVVELVVGAGARTVGSRSTRAARGTCLPPPVSDRKVLMKASSPPPMVLSIWQQHPSRQTRHESDSGASRQCETVRTS